MSPAAALARASWAGILAGVALAQAAAHATEPRSGTAMPRYQVVADCPTRQAWEGSLGARLPEELRAEAAGFSVSIELERASGYRGTLGSTDPSAEARVVRGASCREVADALALIAALELRRNAPPRAAADPALTRDEPRSIAPDAVADAGLPADRSRAGGGLRLGVVGFALLEVSTSPRSTTDFGAGIRLNWQSEHFEPWLLWGVYGGDEEIALPGGAATARFDRWASYLVGCPLRFPRHSAAAFRPCLSADVGRLRGEGRGVRLARDSSAWLAGMGAELRLEWLVLDRIELGAQLGAVLNLSRPRFFFAPDFTALEVAPLGLRTGASAGVAF